MTERVVILVTGANRGIGYQIVQSLAKYFSGTSSIAGKSFTYLVGARNRDSIKEAVALLRASLEDNGLPNADIQGIWLDITDDKSIQSAVEETKKRFDGLDVLINNAGIAPAPSDSLQEARETYGRILDTNVTSVANTITAFAPLLQAEGRRSLVVNISSARGSIERLKDPQSPKTLVVPYSVSKVALNGLTLELAKIFEGIEFQLVNPGHCATALNGHRGKRDPAEGAGVVVLLVERWLKGRSECGFWETVGSDWELARVPW